MIMSPKKEKVEAEVEEEKPQVEELTPAALEALLAGGPPDDEMRIVGLYGDINEEKAQETLSGLLVLHNSGKREDEEGGPVWEPMEFLISTYGGNADDMFALYDIMRMIQQNCEIHTFGVGKVMSAGVLLLAAGTKGQRKIGKNCRVMIHSVIGGNHGSIHSLENEMEEIRNSQETYMEALVKETSLTKRTLKKLLERKVNVYLSATEAIEYGIADIIV